MSFISEVSNWKYLNLIKNKKANFNKNHILKVLSKNEIDEAYKSISKWDNYYPTPLISLNKLSQNLKLNKIFYKDESKRFNLKSFKALGGAYAVEKITNGNIVNKKGNIYTIETTIPQSYQKYMKQKISINLKK